VEWERHEGEGKEGESHERRATAGGVRAAADLKGKALTSLRTRLKGSSWGGSNALPLCISAPSGEGNEHFKAQGREESTEKRPD
jgi:hypothetical protein